MKIPFLQKNYECPRGCEDADENRAKGFSGKIHPDITNIPQAFWGVKN